MTRADLYHLIQERASYLCVGLDIDLDKIPAFLKDTPDGLWEFNRRIIDATKPYCVAYKPNLAFYEALGLKGWELLQQTIDYIGDSHFIIADAKRGDIGNTSRLYARAFFDTMGCDAVTVAPYMGADSVKPFLGFPGKWAIVLALTSNPGSADFQFQPLEEGRPLYEKVLDTTAQWGSPEELMFVVGATHPEQFRAIRKMVPEHFLLVPGVGAQGGDLEQISKHGWNSYGGLLVNASRSILYASNGSDFDQKAAEEALRMQAEMQAFMRSQAAV